MKILKEKKNKKLTSIPKSKNTSLKEKFKHYKGKNLAKEFSWDENVGKEKW